MTYIELSKKQARLFLLKHQGLLPPRELKGKMGIMKLIDKINCIQFDPLNKVGKNPHLVLQSRIKDYQRKYIEELLYSERKLLDGFDKNMCIYSVNDWPYFQRYRDYAFNRHGGKSSPTNKILPKIKSMIKKNGPQSSKDLKFDNKVKWSWGPTRASRAALESMYLWGELIIHHKVGTRKIYDFAKNHLPSELLSSPDPNDSIEKFFEWSVKRRIGSIGMLWNRSGDAWLGIRWMKTKERNEAISNLEENGEIIPIIVEDNDYTFYICKEEEDLLQDVSNGIDFKPKVSIIAPLDNMLWDRKMIKELFGFEYVWEVYKPVVERKYGYYVLPLLYGDRFIARFEPSFDKKTSILEIYNWWWEAEISITEELKKALIECFHDFLNYLGANEIQLAKNIPKDLKFLTQIYGN